jgi:hypothetical protein
MPEETTRPRKKAVFASPKDSAKETPTSPTVHESVEEQPATKKEETPRAQENHESVGESVGEKRPTSVGRNNPTDSPTPPKSIFGNDRKANVKGRKLHPLQVSGQKNLTLREHLIGAIALLADREGLASQPGKVADFLLEYAFEKLAPDILAEAYQDVCDDIGVKNDRV